MKTDINISSLSTPNLPNTMIADLIDRTVKVEGVFQKLSEFTDRIETIRKHLAEQGNYHQSSMTESLSGPYSAIQNHQELVMLHHRITLTYYNGESYTRRELLRFLVITRADAVYDEKNSFFKIVDVLDQPC